MGLLFPWLEWSLFLLVTEACEVSILMTRPALKFLCWTLETFNMFESPRFWHLSLYLYTFLASKVVLQLCCLSFVSFLWSGDLGLAKEFLSLVLASLEVCVLMSHQTDMSKLWVTCHLLDMPGSCLWTLHFLCKLPDLACGKLVRSILLSLIVLETNSSSLRKNQKMSPWGILAVSWGVLSQSNLGRYCIVSFINRFVALPEASKQVKAGPYFIPLWLAELFIFPQIVSSISSSLDKLHVTYWSIPKSPFHAITFFYCFFLVTWQAHTPVGSHTSSTIYRICGIEHQPLLNPS